MAINSPASLVDALTSYRLLTPDQLREVPHVLQSRFSTARELAKEMVRRGWLTVYQVNQLFQTDGHTLCLGPFRILELIGEGGVSQVFKAWHTGRDSMVALKVIRPEMLSNTEALGRFRREMAAVARLSHPHIVQAFDVVFEGDSHYFAMEYLTGTDLSKLVGLSGPVAPRLACDYIRQAALGLQHVHEHGLVHRDIKPQNLWLTTAGAIKILDMGLARLRQPKGQPGSTDNLTQEGIVIGTPDYLAPEQARDPRTVDIRADIYGLGCTLYYLLVGQPPFPGGSVMQKLFKHQQEKPKSGQFLRPDVQRMVGAVLEKMLAKQPEDRYQSPAGVAAALVPFTSK